MATPPLLAGPPHVELAHIGGSGTWAFAYPDGALDGHPHLSVKVVEPDLRFATPFGPSPSFRLCRLTDGRTGRELDYLYVWMHGIDPQDKSDAPGQSALAAERVFDVLARAGVRRVFVDNSTGGLAEDLSPWDLVIVGDVVDLSGSVPRPVPPGLIRFRAPLCPRLARRLAASVEANWTGYADLAGGPGATPHVKAGAIYVHSGGPWFETPTEDRTYRRLGFDVVGKTAGPEFRLARMYRMCLGILSIVVNPAEGLGEFEHEDLGSIYRKCGPVMARMVIEALAAAPGGPSPGAGNPGGLAGDGTDTSETSDEADCHCASSGGTSLFHEFSRYALYRGGHPHA